MTYSLFRFLLLGCAAGATVLLANESLLIEESADVIEISRGSIPVLTYHKAEVFPPAGEADAFRRSGFIHPLHTPKGAVISSIHAPDHIHHMGLWHAWVHTTFRDEALDFWNLKALQGTVRFAGSRELTESSNSVGFSVRQEHVRLAGDGGRREEVVLAEDFSVSVVLDAEANVVDYVMKQRNVTDASLLLPAYRYGGGVAFRAPESWNDETGEYLTSEGLSRENGHATRGRWCAMYGPTEYGEATVVIMGHPQNHDAPQRMRIWPEGKVFFNFVPTQESDWEIPSRAEIELHYRVLVFDGRPSVEEIEARWSHFAKK